MILTKYSLEFPSIPFVWFRLNSVWYLYTFEIAYFKILVRISDCSFSLSLSLSLSVFSFSFFSSLRSFWFDNSIEIFTKYFRIPQHFFFQKWYATLTALIEYSCARWMNSKWRNNESVTRRRKRIIRYARSLTVTQWSRCWFSDLVQRLQQLSSLLDAIEYTTE